MATTKKTKMVQLRESYLFGFRSIEEHSQIILMSVPWEVTTSYGGGTSLGPKAIYDASPQLDLFDLEIGEPFKVGLYLKPEDSFFKKQNAVLKKKAQMIIKANEKAAAADPDGLPRLKMTPLLKKSLEAVNSGCKEMVHRVYTETQNVLAAGKIPGLIGGDHSTPLGAIQAVCEKFAGEVGVLHIDAHADLRLSYQGFQHSHASIMRNVCQLPKGPQKLVQIGIRDFCREEFDFIQANKGRVKTFFDREIKSALSQGQTWSAICHDVLKELPERVYVSFDIDGLSPEFCPHTGTPVAGGLSFDQALDLMGALGRSGKRIVGFDLNEVAPGESDWDGNVGARILYKLCGWAAKSNNLNF